LSPALDRGAIREKRRPNVAEIVQAAPDHPVYVQHLYDWLLLSPKAMEILNIREDADVVPAASSSAARTRSRPRRRRQRQHAA